MKEIVINLKRLRPPAMSARTLLRGAVVACLVFLAYEMLYEVQPDEVGVVLRFGRYVKTVPPGLHVDLPFIDSQVIVPAQRQLKEEFGFRRPARAEEAARAMPDESLMLTGDLNVAKVEWVVQYRITNAYNYLFRVRDSEGTLRDLAEASMRQVVGDRTLTEVLTVGRPAIESQVQADLQGMVTKYDMGITIKQVSLQAAAPPDPVKPAWDEVTQAQQQRDRRINEARGEYNKVIPRAKGEAEQAVLQAEGGAIDRINSAEGEAARFVMLYDAYRKAPEVTRERMYLETMTRVLPRVGNKLFIDKDAKGILVPLLPPETAAGLLGAQKPKGGGAQ